MSTVALIEKVQSYVGRFAFWRRGGLRRRKKGNAVRKISSASLSNLPPAKQKELEFLCNKLFQKQELIASGRLQLLGLTKVKQRVGRRWAGLQLVIYEICDEIIQKYMVRGDISIRYRDDSYILLFTSCSMAESALKATIIAREIRDCLFAEDNMQDIEILQQAANIKASAVNSNIPFPDSLNIAFESSYNAEREEAKLPAAKADISALQRIDVDAFAGHRKAMPLGPEFETESLPFRAVHYLPVWDHFKKGLVAHLCLAFDGEANLSPLSAHLDFYARRSPSEIANMDLAILGSIISWMKNNPGSFENFGIICPVHYETIDRIEGKGKYRALCQKINSQMKPYILFMVLDVPLKMPWLSLNHVVSPLKTYGRVLCGHLPLNADIDFKSLRMAGFDNVGVILNNLSQNDVEIQKKTLTHIKSFIARAKKSLITQTFVLGIDDNALAAAVAASGVRYMGGGAVHSCISTPLEKINFENAALFAGSK